MQKLIKLVPVALLLMACNNSNPLLTEQNTPYGVPAFDKIELKHYKPAFEAAIKEYEMEIAAIENNEAEPTFENTIAALDRSGSLLRKVEGVFFNLLETDGTDEMNALAEEVTPLITTCSDNILLSDKLFARVKQVYDLRDEAGLSAEQLRLTEETYRSFVSSGANLPAEAKDRLREINQELGLLSLKFGQNVVAETNSDAVKRFITDEAQLSGLPESAKAAAAEEAAAAGHPGEWLFTPKRTSFTPVLQYCDNRELRQQLLMDYTTRGNHDNENDNKAIINQTMRLRTEKAHLFGYDCSADYILQDAMAKNGRNAMDMLLKVWGPSLEAVKRERAALQAMMPEGEKLEPWDWWYYAEKLRQEKYALSEEELRPYFELNNVRRGAFDLAHRLYGITIEPIQGLPIYHPDVETFKVCDADGSLLGIFYTDYFPRDTKRPGAWMNAISDQYITAEGEDIRPVIINVGNFTKPTAGNPSLLSMDDVETLFHEFGHALHGLLTRCHYRTLSGTSVPRDFVELPSQFMENYCYEPEMLRSYAHHYQTGEVIPDELIEKINRAGKFNQGFVETELLSASILDLNYHMLTQVDTIDVNAFEAESLKRMGMIDEIITRYRSTFYNHIFTTGYEAGYYSYTWSAVLDADAFAAFKETGDIFNPEVAKRFRHILQSGNTEDVAQMYLNFRGKEADPKYLLERKGL